MNTRTARNTICPALLLVLCLCFPFAALSAQSAPLTNGSSQNGMVRAKLSSLGAPATLKLTVYGSYTVNGQSSKTLKSGSTVTVKCSGGSLTLTSEGSTVNMGTSFRLRRHATSGQNGVKIAQSRVPGNLYPGDFTFTANGSSISTVASIYMEDYLYGVLPYEMGDASGMEALKAQAVAARTYTMRAKNASTGRSYDVVDTTADQVYNGTPSGSANCKKAVDATKGIVVKNGSALTATYYTASNGGQTESIKNAWGTQGLGYLTVKADPYDLRNSASARRSFTVSASGKQSNTALNQLLNQKAASAFGRDAVLTAVTDVAAHTPRYAAPSQLNTLLTFTVRYTAGGQSWEGALTFDIFNELEKPLGMSINTMKNALWTVDKTAGGFTVSARRYGHGIGMSQRGAMQMAKEGMTYDQILAFYYEGCTRVRYTLSRSILSPVTAGQNSQEQVIDESPANLDEPAPTRAPMKAIASARVTTPQGPLNLRKAPRDTADVLLTIPQGETVPVLEKGTVWCTVTYGNKTGHVMTQFLAFAQPSSTPKPAKAAATSAPAPSASPAPAKADGKQYAQVKTPHGSLNLRKYANDRCKVLTTIPPEETVQIVKKNANWTKVSYRGKTGYVMTKFLAFGGLPIETKEEKSSAPAQKAVSSTNGSTANGSTARVQPKNGGSLYLRKTKNGSSKILDTLPYGTQLTVLSQAGAWCKVKVNGKTGFVMTKHLAFSGEKAASKTGGASAAKKDVLNKLKIPVEGTVTSPNGKKLNMRIKPQPNVRVLLKIPAGEKVTILSVGDTWCQVEYKEKKGFCMKEYLEFTLHE